MDEKPGTWEHEFPLDNLFESHSPQHWDLATSLTREEGTPAGWRVLDDFAWDPEHPDHRVATTTTDWVVEGSIRFDALADEHDRHPVWVQATLTGYTDSPEWALDVHLTPERVHEMARVSAMLAMSSRIMDVYPMEPLTAGWRPTTQFVTAGESVEDQVARGGAVYAEGRVMCVHPDHDVEVAIPATLRGNTAEGAVCLLGVHLSSTDLKTLQAIDSTIMLQRQGADRER